ncbi:hypothetical protein HUB98_25305 [Paenibacillus barcinonensis]|uniref:Uncharacterized protein n=1 Tax=Paenibacillus barcinonensis TaxID=198119 RepID=A0A2V4VRC3_PAEBA|nr:hypothetical protein [Paenibacillus barcinonensis]PYE52669.1 hypothetical protein DFQ00_101609 [Paenibacillus barcinonensis]QKS59187.1 hypothetical protein HUB98_25305 [Paenibacillus barcinonensis]
METTVCPWCHTEIVWDEELGPEEECPYCHNELKGYRTLNINIGDEESADTDEVFYDAGSATDQEQISDLTSLWGDEVELKLPELRTLNKYADEGNDLIQYEQGVEKQLDQQEEVPECPNCREFMILAGSQAASPDTFIPIANAVSGKGSVLSPPFTVLTYVCSGCFQVQYSLSEDDRLRLIQNLSVQ